MANLNLPENFVRLIFLLSGFGSSETVSNEIPIISSDLLSAIRPAPAVKIRSLSSPFFSFWSVFHCDVTVHVQH